MQSLEKRLAQLESNNVVAKLNFVVYERLPDETTEQAIGRVRGQHQATGFVTFIPKKGQKPVQN